MFWLLGGIWSHHFMVNRWGKSGNSDRFYFWGSKITVDSDCSHENKKTFAPWKKSYDQPRQDIKKQRHYFANKGPSSQSYGFSSSHVWMWELYHKEGWVLKNWSFQTVVLEKPLEILLDSKEIKPVNPKGNQPWIFTGRTDAEAPILWPWDVKSRLIGKDPDARLDWGKEEKEVTEDERVGWQHWLDGPEFEQTSGQSEGQGRLTCCSQWGHRELDTTSWLNNKFSLLCHLLCHHLLTQHMRMDRCWKVTVTWTQQADDRSALHRREDPSDLFRVLLWILLCHDLLCPPMSWVNQSLSWYPLKILCKIRKSYLCKIG